ncbi:VOC family protein [Rhodanobacter denitrificans]|uniref:VOC family protein n=1 Tax=Rhodanobacter denitrificans TaxID=666685 RepID=UPI000260C7F4|nr:VOC family protein [Rhodanobacter denitrificans]EIM04233.1 glyoxalase/bleomycin resistance protein/dioxygenase [Rhodanobacter denitrificans]UJM88952.1 VOC family protein [Rhodanobacter denitrificans]
MGKSLLSRLFLVLGMMSVALPGAGAATLYGGDYARIGVPDLQQAVAFFRDVLNCRPLDPAAGAVDSPRQSSLLACDAGSIIELFDERDATLSPARPSPEQVGRTLRFVTDDVVHADQWLRDEGVDVSGMPHRLSSGPLTGRLVLDFVSPWGLRLQLLDSKATGSVDSYLAAVEMPLGGD